MKAIYKDFIGIYENAFSNQYIDNLLKFYNTNFKIKPRSNYNSESKNQVTQDNVFTGTQTKNKFTDSFFKKLGEIYLADYLEKYASFKQVVDQARGMEFQEFQVQKTSPTEGYHQFHSEWSSIAPLFDQKGNRVMESVIDRVLAWTLYLNDIKEGGETEFLYQSLRVKPKKGLLCIFPSFPTHYHRGNPPLKEDKYIATGWIRVQTTLEAAYNPTIQTPIADPESKHFPLWKNSLSSPKRNYL